MGSAATYRSNERPDVGRVRMRNELPEVPRSEELLLDVEAVSRALKAPLPPRIGAGVDVASGVRPKYRLEDRLNGAGVVGSIMPPSEFHLNLMRPTLPPKRRSSLPAILGIALVVLTSITGTVIYRDMTRPPPLPAQSSE